MPAHPRLAGTSPAATSNDIALAQRVLFVAFGTGYLVEDLADGDLAIWRETDAAATDPSLRRPEPDEAAMVVQLLDRGRLQPAGRPCTRTTNRAGLAPGCQSHEETQVEPLTVPAVCRQTLNRWTALAAVPTQKHRSTHRSAQEET